MKKTFYWAIGLFVTGILLEMLYFFLWNVHIPGISRTLSTILGYGALSANVLGFLFQVLSLLLILWVLLRGSPKAISFVKRTFKDCQDKIAAFKKNQKSKNAYLELMKSKALLDAGSITEEEHTEKANALKSSIQ